MLRFAIANFCLFVGNLHLFLFPMYYVMDFNPDLRGSPRFQCFC